MQKSIHPNWNNDSTITCACGNSFQAGSTLDSLQVDICSACHPFFTGEMKFVDTQGRVDHFLQKMKAAEQHKATSKSKATKKQKSEDQKSYKQLLQEQKTTVKSAAKAA